MKLLSSGPRRNQRKAAWGEEQTGHANPRALETSSASAFSYCATQRPLEPCGPFTRTTTRQLAWPCRDLRGGPSPLPLRGTLSDGDDRAPAVRGVRRSRVCLLRGVWPLLCGAVLRVHNVLPR